MHWRDPWLGFCREQGFCRGCNLLRDPGFGFCREPSKPKTNKWKYVKTVQLFLLKPSNPFAFYLTFLSEKFWHITCNPQIISTRCTQNANMFSHLPSIHPAFLIFPLWLPWYLHRWTASGTKGTTNGVDIREANICKNANKRHIKRKNLVEHQTSHNES